MLEYFAGHRRLGDSLATKVADVGSDPGDAAGQIAVANLCQHRVGMTRQADAVDFQALVLERLGNDDRKAAPAGDQADFRF